MSNFFFAHSSNLEVTFNLRDEDIFGVDPSVFKRFVREMPADLEEEEDANEEGEDGEGRFHDKRCQVKDYKMPRRKTTRRKRRPDIKDDFFTDRSNEENSEIVDLMDTSQQMQIQHEQYPSSSVSGTNNKKLAKHSDETSSYEIQRTRSGSNTPHQVVADTCDPRISQGMEILQRRMDALDHKMSTELNEMKRMLITLNRQLEASRANTPPATAPPVPPTPSPNPISTEASSQPSTKVNLQNKIT